MSRENDIREMGRHFINLGRKAAEEVVGQIAQSCLTQNCLTQGSDLRQKVWDSAGAFFNGAAIPVRITRRAADFVVEAQLPGRGIEEIEVVVLDDTVTIRGRKLPHPQLEETSVVVSDEFGDRDIERIIRLPEVVDNSRVNAAMKRGVLKVTLGRRQGTEVSIVDQEK
jgi:HSP20 family molecular chaperone IbpA